MTTIAYKDGDIAADTMASTDLLKVPCQKLFYVPNKKAIIGTSGESYSSMVFVDWYRDRRRSEPEFTKDEDFECIVVKKDCIETWNQSLRPVEIECSFYAIGHGAGVALGAMEAGATAGEAVRIACKWDLYTGGEVQVRNLEAEINHERQS